MKAHVLATLVLAAGFCLSAQAAGSAPPATSAPSTSAGAPAPAPAASTAAPAATPPAAPAAAPPAAPSPEQLSYWYGVQFGDSLKSVGVGGDLRYEALARGIKDGVRGKALSSAEQMQLKSHIGAAMQDMVKHNEGSAREFLARNGKEKGIVTTASGLQYRIVSPGDPKAAAVTATDEVTVNYRGKLLDGSEFDSSYARGVPLTLRVNGVIRGWQEALVLMKPGSKWQLFVPPDLAYGTSPRPGIPGGSLLIFDVELLSTKPAATPPRTGPAPRVPSSK
ncbi:MAG TPA: FKBP-type peptidyl-prolyl cis-trans isomerase [Steroidobacteraceae bacterium]|nr:FKBP-type peptidyl-prolyl cis-trans isomerase [Steroidobacteraceae bacterium]